MKNQLKKCSDKWSMVGKSAEETMHDIERFMNTIIRYECPYKMYLKTKNINKCSLNAQIFMVYDNMSKIRFIEDTERLAAIILEIPEAYKWLLIIKRHRSLNYYINYYERI